MTRPVIYTPATTKEVIPAAAGCDALAEWRNQELHDASLHHRQQFSIFQCAEQMQIECLSLNIYGSDSLVLHLQPQI